MNTHNNKNIYSQEMDYGDEVSLIYWPGLKVTSHHNYLTGLIPGSPEFSIDINALGR